MWDKVRQGVHSSVMGKVSVPGLFIVQSQHEMVIGLCAAINQDAGMQNWNQSRCLTQSVQLEVLTRHYLSDQQKTSGSDTYYLHQHRPHRRGGGPASYPSAAIWHWNLPETCKPQPSSQSQCREWCDVISNQVNPGSCVYLCEWKGDWGPALCLSSDSPGLCGGPGEPLWHKTRRAGSDGSDDSVQVEVWDRCTSRRCWSFTVVQTEPCETVLIFNSSPSGK